VRRPSRRGTPCTDLALRPRTLILGATLAFIGLLAFLTISVLVREGPDILTVVSLLILALFGFGIVGALSEDPPDG
jgi:hypothetical protein